MIGKKLEEARRLVKYASTVDKFNPIIIKLNSNYLVSILIRNNRYSYIVDMSHVKLDIDERNMKFAKFVADSILNSRKRGAIWQRKTH